MSENCICGCTAHASQLKKEKKELEQISTILEYNFEHSEDQMENAKARLFQIEEDSIVRQHSKFLASDCTLGSKNTRYHFRIAKKSFSCSQMKEMLTMNNELKKDQKGIELANVEYWSHIMRKRAICRGDLACITCNQRVCENALNIVVSTIPNNAKMSNESKEVLGQNKSPVDFLTTQDLLASIRSLKLNKSRGPDGLPIEFYELLCERPNRCQKFTKWLKAIFVQSYMSGMLPSHMRKSQIRLIYKKETEEDKKYPKTIDPLPYLTWIIKSCPKP